LRQRVLIARSLIASWFVLFADVAITALDTRLTRMVLDQLAELTQQNIALAIISHDLAQIAHVADDIIVMRHGQIVEAGRAHDILSDPSHVYTQQLLDAVPSGVPRFVPLTRPTGSGPGRTKRKPIP